VTQSRIQLAIRFEKFRNVLGADIRNECGMVLGEAGTMNDIKEAQEGHLGSCSRMVVFVEGTMNSPASMLRRRELDWSRGCTLMPDVAERFFYTPHAMADFGYFERDNFSPMFAFDLERTLGIHHQGHEVWILTRVKEGAC